LHERLIAEHVRYVVIDSAAEASNERVLLARAVEGDPATFHPIGRFPISDRAGRRHGELTLYENPAAVRPHETRVRLSLDRGGRVLVYRWP
jgi:hypothetical protein